MRFNFAFILRALSLSEMEAVYSALFHKILDPLNPVYRSNTMSKSPAIKQEEAIDDDHGGPS